MKERPILFSGEMVRAILAGRKTQTRRVMWPKSLLYPYRNCMEKIHLRITKSHYLFDLHHDDGTVSTIYGTRPRYNVGDRLWVRETFLVHSHPNILSPHGEVVYRGDFPDSATAEPGWKPSIFMPRWASRITLEVTGVRVERVKEISEEDAKAEGVSYLFTEEECKTVVGLIGSKPEDHGYTNYLWHGRIGRGITGKQSDEWYHQYSGYDTAKGSYSSLWQSINASRGYGWDANPWVWVIEFKVVSI